MGEIKYFFSYARKDTAFVLKLAKELRAAGVNLWIDQLDILGGRHWDRAVEQALETCHGMIAVLSPESLASTNVMDEVSYALEEEKGVIPILLRSCTIPMRLRRIHYIDFTTNYNEGFSQLLRALQIEQARETSEPPAPIKHATRQLPSRVRCALVGGAAGAIWGTIAVLVFNPASYPLPPISRLYSVLFVGIFGAITGAISGKQWRAIAIVIVGIIMGASIWMSIDISPPFAMPYDAAVVGVSFGALAGAIVGVIIKKWQGWR